MGLFGTVMRFAKARMMGRMLRRGFGGPIGTALMMAYFGKKAYDMTRGSRRRRVA